MKIYTRGGDAGDTARLDGRRMRKCDPVFEALGTLDELNSQLGLCLAAAGDDPAVRETIQRAQDNLLRLGAQFAAAGDGTDAKVALDSAAVERMEERIDELTERLAPLEHFVLPGGCELSARLHVARTVCRRAERRFAAHDGHVPPVALIYLNRLSDLLFTLARAANAAAGVQDAIWIP